MATLYRKYRPQNFKEVVGQNHVKIILQNEIEASNIAHAYLFCGPRAIGKTTIARVLAKAINCEKKKEGEHEPCNTCSICNEITNGRNLDIIEIDAASHTGVDNVRENIISFARVNPSRCKYKVFIIDEVHMLSISAFNALLKTIEEPPDFVVFILCTTEIHKVPTTIVSRCQRFDFKRISITDIVQKLNYIIKKEGIEIDKKILEAIAHRSEGHMRDAESILGQIVSIGGKKITQEEADLVLPRSDINEIINLIKILSNKECAKGIGLINKMIDDGIDLKTFITDFIEVLRKVMLNKINPSLTENLRIELGEAIEIKINEASVGISLDRVIIIIEKFIEASNKMKISHIAQLPVELAIVELCSVTENKIQKTVNRSPESTPEKILNQPIGKVNSEEILARWPEFLNSIKKYNHSLSLILRVCQPKDLNNNQLCLAFKYKFHKERISNIEIKNLVEKVLREVYGLPLTIEAVIDESMELNGGTQNAVNYEQTSLTDNQNDLNDKGESSDGNKKDDNMIDNLLKTFGGKVVK
ncbi:MAG: DNA polymerase III subunit gamma/tau [Patescibacteria group bacterium]